MGLCSNKQRSVLLRQLNSQFLEYFIHAIKFTLYNLCHYQQATGTALVKRHFYCVSSELQALQKVNRRALEGNRKQELRRVGDSEQTITWSTLTLKASVNTTREKALLSYTPVSMPLANNTMLLHVFRSKLAILFLFYLNQPLHRSYISEG